MSGDLFTSVAEKPQRETAGSDSASRFDYQKDWAFCRMIRKHIEGVDYLVAFEFHDDVVFLTPSTHPTNAEFCQVKTSRSQNPRKLSSLTARPRSNRSILAKMFANFDRICASHEINVTLVSNTVFDFSDSDVCASDLHQKLRTKLVNKLKQEIPDFDETYLEKLHFKVTGVSLDAMDSYLSGEAMTLFSHKFGEDHGLNIYTWIRLLRSEIRRKNNHPSDEICSANELVTHKCISQGFVEETLNTMHAKARDTVDMTLVSTALLQEGWGQQDVMRLRKKLPQASNDYYDPTNKEVRDIAEQMKAHMTDSQGGGKNLGAFLVDSAAALAKKAGGFNPYLQQDYLFALGVFVYNEEI